MLVRWKPLNPYDLYTLFGTHIHSATHSIWISFNFLYSFFCLFVNPTTYSSFQIGFTQKAILFKFLEIIFNYNLYIFSCNWILFIF